MVLSRLLMRGFAESRASWPMSFGLLHAGVQFVFDEVPQLAPAIERITRRTGRPPRAVTADRGYGQASVERNLHELGVRSVAIPRVSKPGAAPREFEHRRAFRDKIKWRTGSEGRINHLKRSYGWDRTELTGITGVRTWCGHGVFAHNLVKIS